MGMGAFLAGLAGVTRRDSTRADEAVPVTAVLGLALGVKED
jgi:hypothetical protein